jgi:hypothetical protein
MRLKEFLPEASIFTRLDKYSYGHKVRVGVSSDKGRALFKAIKQVVPDYDPIEDIEWVEKAPRGTATVQFGKGENLRSFKRSNNSYFNIAGSDSAIQGGLIHAPGQKGSTEGNVGDLSEPVLSAAVVAKLIKRGSNKVENIDIEDLKNVLNDAVFSGTSSYKPTDKNSAIADLITFTLAVREPTKLFMQKPEFWDHVGGIAQSAVHYANSGQIDRYADYFYKNGKVDEIRVQSDGMSDQKGRKTDIEAYVKGEDGQLRSLKNIKISLKAGSSQFGQQGAGSVTSDVTSAKGIYQSSVNFFSPLGIELSPPSKAPTTKIEWWNQAYNQAAQQLSKLLAGDNAKSEAGIVTKIADMIVNHATKGDETVRLVQLSKKGVSAVHSFRGLLQKLISDNINLTVDYRVGKSKTGEPRPEINIKDANSGKSLVKLGYHATGDNKKIWNAITMEPLLAELTTMATKQPAPGATTNQTPTAAKPDELQNIKNLAGIKSGPNTSTLQGTQFSTPGTRNMNKTLGGSREPMGANPQ